MPRPDRASRSDGASDRHRRRTAWTEEERTALPRALTSANVLALQRSAGNAAAGAVLRGAGEGSAVQRFPYVNLLGSTKPGNIQMVALLRARVRAADNKIDDDAKADEQLKKLANSCTNDKQLAELLEKIPNRIRLTNLLLWMDHAQDAGTDLLKMLNSADHETLKKLRDHHSKPTASSLLSRRRRVWLGEAGTPPAEAVAVAEGARQKKPPDEFTLNGARYKGMTPFDNDSNRVASMVLPTRVLKTDAAITYEELDIFPFKPGVDRGSHRIVLGSDGARYYTSDHYISFVKF